LWEYQGKKWLIQRLRVNKITGKSLTDFTAKPKLQPKLLTGAFVEDNYNIHNLVII